MFSAAGTFEFLERMIAHTYVFVWNKVSYFLFVTTATRKRNIGLTCNKDWRCLPINKAEVWFDTVAPKKVKAERINNDELYSI
jgi:hypothetical protein